MFTVDDLHLIAEIADHYHGFRVYLNSIGAKTNAAHLAAISVVQGKAEALIRELEKAMGDPKASKAPPPAAALVAAPVDPAAPVSAG